MLTLFINRINQIRPLGWWICYLVFSSEFIHVNDDIHILFCYWTISLWLCAYMQSYAFKTHIHNFSKVNASVSVARLLRMQHSKVRMGKGVHTVTKDDNGSNIINSRVKIKHIYSYLRHVFCEVISSYVLYFRIAFFHLHLRIVECHNVFWFY